MLKKVRGIKNYVIQNRNTKKGKIIKPIDITNTLRPPITMQKKFPKVYSQIKIPSGSGLKDKVHIGNGKRIKIFTLWKNTKLSQDTKSKKRKYQLYSRYTRAPRVEER